MRKLILILIVLLVCGVAFGDKILTSSEAYVYNNVAQATDSVFFVLRLNGEWVRVDVDTGNCNCPASNLCYYDTDSGAVYVWTDTLAAEGVYEGTWKFHDATIHSDGQYVVGKAQITMLDTATISTIDSVTAVGTVFTLYDAVDLTQDAEDHIADTLRDVTGDTLTVLIDSVLTAITTANKANFKATGFAVAGDQMNLTQDAEDHIADTLRDVFGDTLTGFIAMVDDSLQGQSWATSGSGIDSATASRIVGRKVWGVGGGSSGDDSVEYANRTVPATATCAGDGAYACSLYVQSDAPAALSNVYVTFSQGGSDFYVTSSAAGWAVFNANAGAVTWVATNSPNTGDNGSFTADASEKVDTATITLVSVSAPSDPDLCRVYGYMLDPDTCQGCDVVLFLEFAGDVATDTAAEMPIRKTVYQTRTDDSGYFYLDVPKTGNIIYRTKGDAAASSWDYAHPTYRLVISSTNWKLNPEWGATFDIPADSTTLNLGQLLAGKIE